MATNVKTIDTKLSANAYHAAAAVSTAAEVIHISGQPGTNVNGEVPDDYESQIELALLNLRKVILIAGCKVSDILSLRFYIVNYDPARRLHTRHIQKFLEGHRPACTLVPVPVLAGANWLFEIEAVVAKPAVVSKPLPAVAAAAGEEVYDVVIVGAGLAGLTAASQVIKAGLSCIVLEARNRVGGRTWSTAVTGGDAVTDLGAAWINDTNQSHMIELARRFGLELIEQNTDGKCVLIDETGERKEFPYGELPPFAATAKANVAFIRDNAEADCQRVNCAYPSDAKLDSMTFKAYLQHNNAAPEAMETASVWTRAMLGHEPEDVSALFFLNYCKSGGGLLQMRSDRKGGGQHLRVRSGTQSFALGLTKSLPAGTVRLSHAITSIEQRSKQTILVRTANKTFKARKVITSVPPPVLKKIEFQPPLPLAKQLLLDSYNYGFYQKVMVVFKTPFWVEKGFCGLTQSFRGPAAVVRDTSSPADNKWILTCFMAGKHALEWSKKGQREREAALLDQIVAFYNSPHARTELVEFVTLPWSDEEFSGFGCPSPSLPPGVLSTAGHAIREPFQDVHFVGTETAEEWKGYMEGAVRSGERGAREVVSGLGKIVSRL